MSARGLAIDQAAWSSAWHHRRTRDKAVLAGGLLAAAVLLPPLPAAPLVALCAGVALLGPAKVSAKVLAHSLRAPALFIVLGGVTLLVTIGGPDRFVNIDAASATAAGTTVLRASAATLAAFVLAATTPMIDVLAALRRLRVPDPLIDIAELMYRLVFVLLESARSTMEAQTARLGYVNRRAGLRSAAAALSAMLLRAFSRARRLEDGLAGRGYVEGLRTLSPPRVGSRRFLVAAMVLIGAIVAMSAFTALAWPGPWTSLRWT